MKMLNDINSETNHTPTYDSEIAKASIVMNNGAFCNRGSMNE